MNRRVIQELYHYGVDDAEKTVLADASFSGRVPKGRSAPSFVSTQDPQRIVLFKIKVGIPLFALRDIEDIERAYNDPDKVISNHVHRDWEQFPAVIPRAGDGEALRWFALAQVPSPRVDCPSRRVVLHPLAARTPRRWRRTEAGQGRVAASQAFEKNRELIAEVKDQIESVTKTEGEAQVSALLRDYADGLVRQVSERGVDPTVKEQVEREVEEIERHLLGDDETALRP